MTMNNAIESYTVIYNNPFILAPLFSAFYSSLPPKPKSILLSYLVLPLVLYPSSREFLTNANARSSIRTMGKKRERFFGLQERLEEYKMLTNICIQHGIDVSTLAVEADLSVRVLGSGLDTSLPPETSVRAAKNLGKLLASFEVPAIYLSLGVKEL